MTTSTYGKFVFHQPQGQPYWVLEYASQEIPLTFRDRDACLFYAGMVLMGLDGMREDELRAIYSDRGIHVSVHHLLMMQGVELFPVS
jgi:hypothetical protein